MAILIFWKMAVNRIHESVTVFDIAIASSRVFILSISAISALSVSIFGKRLLITCAASLVPKAFCSS